MSDPDHIPGFLPPAPRDSFPEQAGMAVELLRQILYTEDARALDRARELLGPDGQWTEAGWETLARLKRTREW